MPALAFLRAALLSSGLYGQVQTSLPQGALAPTGTQAVTLALNPVASAFASPIPHSPFSILNSPLLLKFADDQGDVVFYVAHDPPLACTGKLGVIDLDSQMPGQMWKLAEQPRRFSDRRQSCLWTMKWHVQGIRRGETGMRRLRLQEKAGSGVVTVSVQNQKWPDQKVTLGSAPHELTHGAPSVEVSAVVEGVPLRSAQVAFSGLVDTSTGVGIPADQIEASVVILDERSARIAISVRDSFTEPGNFGGQIFLRSPEQPQIGPLQLVVHSTNGRAKTLGILIIGLGCVLFAAIGIGRQYSRWADALMPATALAERASALERRSQKVKAKTGVAVDCLLGKTNQGPGELEKFQNQLTPEALKGVLPGKWFPGLFDDGARSAAYTAMIQSKATVLESYSMIVILGLESIAAGWPSLSDVEKQKAWGNLTVLDRMAVLPEAPGQVRLAVLNQVSAAVPALGGSPLSYTTEKLSGEVRATAMATWVFGIATTIALGIVIQVILNPGFGTPADYLKCMLWGWGLPAAGQTLQSLMPGSVLSAFNLSLMR